MRRRLIFAALAACLLSCDRDERVVAGGHVLTEPTQLCRGRAAACRKASEVEALLQRDDLEILAATSTDTGKQGARVLVLRAGGVVFRAKWRPDASATRRNSPRLELGAYEVQKLFLEPHEYVVPPTAAHCFPLATYRAKVERTTQPTRGSCVGGILSYWLEDAVAVADAQRAGWFHGLNDHAYDPVLAARDHGYRDSVGRVNILTYVIGHRDSHARNFVLARGPSTAVYAVDNSLAFTMASSPRIPPERDWSKIQVPALPRAVIDRLRDAARRTPSLAKTAGLTAAEIAGVRDRMLELVTRVERGDVRVY